MVNPIQNQESTSKGTQPLEEIPVGTNTNNNTFDDKPIGKSENTFMMSQFPDGAPPEEAPQTTYSMNQKLKSKAVKMRLSGLEDLLAMITNEPDNPELSEVSLPALLKETTPANMEKILQCLKVWMEANRSWGEDEARNAIENGFINGKANTKKLTVEIVDQMYESKPDIIEMLILVGFKNKTPKIIAGYNSILNELLAIYGIRRMKYLKPYLPQVVRVIGAEKLAAVKTEGMNTLKEAYKWMGKETVEPMLSNLKQALKNQLDKEWEAYDKTIIMSAPKDLPEQGGKNKGKKIDAYELSEAVDVFKKYNEKWSESVLKAQKWNQKTKMIEEFVKAASVPKLANTENRHIAELVRRLIIDSNFNVVLWTLKILGVMSKGLRKNFAATAKSQFANIIAKFRQKRTQMVEQTFATLNDLSHCLAIQDVIDDVKEGLGDKAPNMRCNLLNWIGKHVQQKAQQKAGECPEKTKDALKRLFPLFEKLLQDGVQEVRETMAKNVAKLELILGEDFFAPIKGKVSKNLMSKIAKVESKPEKAKEEPKKTETELAKSMVSLKQPSKPDNKLSTIKSTNLQKEKEKQQKPILQCYDEPFFDQCLQILIGLGMPEQQIKNVTANGANERSKLLVYLSQNPYQNFNAVIRVIRRAFKEWKEVNLKMNKDLLSYLEQRVADIGKPEAYVLVPYIAEKIADNKFSQQLLNLITSMCQRVPAKFLIAHFIKYAQSPENKKPKLNGDICSILIKIIEHSSINNCNTRELADYAKETYAVPFSKKGAQELLACLYSHLGDTLRPLLDEATLKPMEAEFKTIKPLNEEQKKPKFEFQGEAAAQSQVLVKKQSSKPQVEGKPRDLSVEVQKALPLMNDNSNWQKRKDGAQILTGQLEFGGRVSFGPSLGDLLTCLKTHVNDTNKQLIKVFVHLAGLVLVALPEKELKVHLKTFIVALVGGLSDKNQQNRNEIISTFGRMAESLGKEQILSNFGPFLQGDKDGRLEVLNLILAHEEGLIKSDIRDYPKGLVSCLCDRNSAIRAAAQRVLQKVHQKLGLQVFRNIAKDQRPAVAKDLNQLFNKFDKNGLTTSSFNSKGVSPSRMSEKEQPKPRPTLTQPPAQHPPPPTSAKKRSLSRNNPGGKSFIEHDEDPHAATTGPFLVGKTSRVEGNELFANLKLLVTERVERQSNEELYVWRLDEVKETQEEAVRADLQGLIREDVARKLLSFDYRRAIEGATQLIKASKDLNQQGQLRELFDVLLKWLLLRLWGGQPGLCTAIELVSPLLSILEKKKAVLTDFEVDLVLAVVREYFVSAALVGPKVTESLYTILKCLVALSSGERVLRKVLRQFNTDLSSVHRHLKREVNAFYREGLCRMIKKELSDHVGNDDTLEQASKIKQLKQDPQFVSMLFRRFHEDVVKVFGFRRLDIANPPRVPPIENSINKLPPASTQIQSTAGNGSFLSTGEPRQRSGERTMPAAGHPSTMSQDLRPSQLGGRPLQRKSNLSQQQIVPPVSMHRPVEQPPLPQQNWVNPYQGRSLDLTIYPSPHPASPLSKHLAKLLPPNESIINFFNTLFQQSGEKISNELATNAKVIFGSILKSVQELIGNRRDCTPERIVAQITLLQSCIRCPQIIRNIGQLLGFGTEFALTQLVYEDQHKSEIYEELRNRNIEYRVDNFIKAVNGVMLRLLENANPQDITNVLLELLTFHSRAAPNSAKTVSLVVKCIGRVCKDFTKDLRPEAVNLFLFRALQFLSSIDYDTPLEGLDVAERERNKEKVRPQDSAANSIKTVLVDVCRSIGSEIWEHYDKAIGEVHSSDRWLNNFIVSLNVKRPEKGRGRSQPNKENEQLKKINELLSKNKSYDAGIAQLKKYSEKHPQFNAQDYFTGLNYDRKFIQMVVGSLDGGRRSTMRADSREQQDLAGESIQDRIRRLKERFQELQPEGESNENSSVGKGKPQEEEQREERAIEIRRRIEEMKNKMNSAVRNR